MPDRNGNLTQAEWDYMARRYAEEMYAETGDLHWLDGLKEAVSEANECLICDL